MDLSRFRLEVSCGSIVGFGSEVEIGGVCRGSETVRVSCGSETVGVG